ncbi:MAG: nuclear transport factor 2 family protein [Candidatus Limnocylindrales bacterium]
MDRRATLQAAFDARDLERLVAMMDDGVVWRGVPMGDEVPHCHDRREVHDMLDAYQAQGGDAHPLVIASSGDSVAVDTRARLADRDGELYQVYTFRGPRIALIQDYWDRESALASLS